MTYISKAIPAQRKKLIICCDGTWQSSTTLDPANETPSNVSRLCRVLASAGTGLDEIKGGENEWQQIVYYDAGVGTGDISSLEKKIQGSQGLGLLENVIEAYNFIVNNYTPGDELFFFGFSRGAFTVRSAAALVAELGVIRPSSMGAFLKLYHEYIKAEDFRTEFHQTAPWNQFVAGRSVQPGGHAIASGGEVVVQVIGVWDTVGALGIPDIGHLISFDFSKLRKQYEFHDTDLKPCVRHAFQALALDEQRASFAPSIWKVGPSNQTTDLVQAWFPGAHTNIGGGSRHKDENGQLGQKEQLSFISYTWMLDRIHPYLAFDELELRAQQAEMLALIVPTGQAQGVPSSLIQAGTDFLKGKMAGARDVAYGYAGGMINDSHTLLYDLLAFPKPRTPLDLGPNEETMRTGEVVHPSVFYRQESERRAGFPSDKIYQPLAMKGWTRETSPGERPRWFKREPHTGRVVKMMEEFEVGGMAKGDSLEGWLIDKTWCDSVREDVESGWKSS